MERGTMERARERERAREIEREPERERERERKRERERHLGGCSLLRMGKIFADLTHASPHGYRGTSLIRNRPP